MIDARDFIWLHFPKCAGTAVERAIRHTRPDAVCDKLDPDNVIWHDNIPQRMKRIEGFHPDIKRILCCIRRLPTWVLSRTHFEAQRPPHRISTREMLITGRFYENGGSINSADTYMKMYTNPPVDEWIRVENLLPDLAESIGVKEEDLKPFLGRVNETQIDFIKDLSFWFTRKELEGLYEANPAWAAKEERVYGSLLSVG